MAPSEGGPKPGSIEDISRRLALWARRDSSGLVRVEYSSEFARQQVIQRLQSLLTSQGILLEELALPTFQDAETVVQTLVKRLEEIAAQPSAVVSVTGFATAFSQQASLEDALRVLNFNRDRYVTLPLRQIWWMTPVFTQNSIQAMPDLNSFFLQRLQLTEVVLPETVAQKLIETDGSTTNIDDARQRAYGLIRQFEIAKTNDASQADLLSTYILPALEALAEVGAQKELRDLTQQFEGMLVQLKVANPLELASSLERLANLYTAQGRYNEAEPLHQKALTLRKQLLGNENPAIAASLNNLALLYVSQGRYEKAEPLYQEALELSQRFLGKKHPDVATSLNNLAGLYRFQSRYREAEPLYQEALSQRKQLLGGAHPDVAQTLNDLAGLYESQGRYSEAEPLYKEALSLESKLPGEARPNVVAGLNNLAGLYGLQGRYSDAEPLAIQALKISTSTLGENHPTVGICLGNLASLWVAQGDFADVEAMLLRAYRIFVNAVGTEHPYTIETVNRLGKFVATMQANGQAHILSDHPLTQALLQQVQGQSSPS